MRIIQKRLFLNPLVKQSVTFLQVMREQILEFFNMLHNHPPDFEEKVLGWRFGPATRQG